MTKQLAQRKTTLLLLLIVLGGFFLRFWRVAEVPNTLNRDEAALAYNALLLKETGKDEWGRSWPLALASFGDYKLPGYPLLLVGTFTLFGYSDLTARLPSILAGTGLILVMYIFGKRVLQLEDRLALLLAFLIAVEPVFFFYSRIAFEANVAEFLTAIELVLLCAPFSGKKKIFADISAAVLMLFAVFTYNTPLLLLPFFIPFVAVWRGWKQPKKYVLAVIGIAFVCVVGFLSQIGLAKQKSGITIFSDESIWRQSVLYHDQFHGVLQKVLGNKALFYGRIILSNYGKAFAPQFLVIAGGPHPWHQMPGFGHLGWIVYLLGISGIALSITTVIRAARNRTLETQRHQLALLLLLFIAPLPASVTVDAPHATRSLLFLLLFVVFAVQAVGRLYQVISKTRYKKIVLCVLTFIFAIETSFYFFTYFSTYQFTSRSILRGNYDFTINDVEHKTAQHVAVIDDGGYQYILTAWYLKMKPTDFFRTIDRHQPDKIGFTYGYKVGKYRFVKDLGDVVKGETIVVFWDQHTENWVVKE